MQQIGGEGGGRDAGSPSKEDTGTRCFAAATNSQLEATEISGHTAKLESPLITTAPLQLSLPFPASPATCVTFLFVYSIFCAAVAQNAMNSMVKITR